jgi:hypothetical protein
MQQTIGKNNLKKRLALAVLFAALFALLPSVALAVSVSQTFKTSGDITSGHIVSLDKEANTVVLANRNNIANLYGVVVGASSLEFSPDNSKGALVATTGVVDAFISTASGAVATGDPIAVGDVEGIGEKAVRTGKIVGVAQGSLDDTTTNAKDFVLNEGTNSRTIKVATIPIKIEVSNYNPAIGLSDGKAIDESDRNKVLQVADNIAGKPVSAIALIVSGIILLIAIFVSTFLLTSSGYASMIAMGRNPLSEKRIMKSLFKLILISLAIFVAGVSLSYLVIKLS